MRGSVGQLRQALAAGLGGHTALKMLWLYGNRIGDGGIKAWHGVSCARMVCWKVGAAVQVEWIVHSSAEKEQIQCSACYLRHVPTWSEVLASALRPHSKLNDLRLHSNSITDVGLQASSSCSL